MNIAIIGNREGFSWEYVKFTLDKHKFSQQHDMILSGGAEGVDTFAQRYAKERGLTFKIFYPRMDVPSPDRYFMRNEQIVLEADLILAFNKKEKSGTKQTMNLAKSFEKEMIVYDGTK